MRRDRNSNSPGLKVLNMLASKYNMELRHDETIRASIPYLIFGTPEFRNELAFALECLCQFYGENQTTFHADQCARIDEMLSTANLPNPVIIKIDSYKYTQETTYNAIQSLRHDIKQISMRLKKLESRKRKDDKINEPSDKVNVRVSNDKINEPDNECISPDNECISPMPDGAQTIRGRVISFLQSRDGEENTYHDISDALNLSMSQVRSAMMLNGAVKRYKRSRNLVFRLTGGVKYVRWVQAPVESTKVQ